jgi:hypothetical protein
MGCKDEGRKSIGSSIGDKQEGQQQEEEKQQTQKLDHDAKKKGRRGAARYTCKEEEANMSNGWKGDGKEGHSKIQARKEQDSKGGGGNSSRYRRKNVRHGKQECGGGG